MSNSESQAKTGIDVDKTLVEVGKVNIVHWVGRGTPFAIILIIVGIYLTYFFRKYWQKVEGKVLRESTCSLRHVVADATPNFTEKIEENCITEVVHGNEEAVLYSSEKHKKGELVDFFRNPDNHLETSSIDNQIFKVIGSICLGIGIMLLFILAMIYTFQDNLTLQWFMGVEEGISQITS